MQDKQVRAPYNFVAFPNQVLRRYQALEEVPRQDRWDPALCSGEITVTLTAETPVFISNGDRNQRDFFRGADGRYQIPGSSLRGLIRENMQILGLGLMRPGVDMQDVTLYYRAIADANSSLKKPLRDHYRAALGIEARKGETGSMPVRVQAGYLHHEKPGSSGDTGYFIRPVKGQFVPIPRKFKRKDQMTGKTFYVNNPEVLDWIERDRPFAEPVYYWYEGTRRRISGNNPERYQAKRGVLMSPGPMARQNHLYLFPEEDTEADQIPISREELISYREDYETRKNTLGGTQKVLKEEKERRKQFWNLPREGENKPVFYCVNGNTTDFGMSYYLRITYDYPLRRGLPASHLAHQEELFLDYPNAVLGFAGSGRSGRLRSRVSVGDLPVNGVPEPIRNLPNIVLGEPKLSFFPAYVKEGRDYNQSDFQLRGYKQYWLHDPMKQAAGSNTKVQSAMRPLPEGTSFTGTIRYQNLHQDELGLLLWCLRLEENCRQPMGTGKPYGYGRMKLTIDSLREFRPEMLYRADSVCPEAGFFAPVEQLDTRVSELIEGYRSSDCVKAAGIENLAELPHIREFFTIRSVIAANTELLSYLRIGRGENEYQNVETPLGTIGDLQEEMQMVRSVPESKPRPVQWAEKQRPYASSGNTQSQQGCKWEVGTTLTGTTRGFTDALVFVRIPGEADQRVYYNKVPGGSFGNLKELLGYHRQVTIRLVGIDPKHGPQWAIDKLEC